MRTSLPNKVRVQIVEPISKGHYQVNTMIIQDPDITNFAWELMVTNGLGYTPVREKMKEGEVTDEVGLIKHLANMEFVTLFGVYQLGGATTSKLASELIDLEREYNNGINCLMNYLKNEISKIKHSPK